MRIKSHFPPFCFESPVTGKKWIVCTGAGSHWIETIMTKYGVSRRVDGYDKKENKSIEFWKDRFYDLILLYTQRYNRQNGIKPKKQKPFKRHGIETYMNTASFGVMGAGGRNHLD